MVGVGSLLERDSYNKIKNSFSKFLIFILYFKTVKDPFLFHKHFRQGFALEIIIRWFFIL